MVAFLIGLCGVFVQNYLAVRFTRRVANEALAKEGLPPIGVKVVYDNSSVASFNYEQYVIELKNQFFNLKKQYRDMVILHEVAHVIDFENRGEFITAACENMLLSKSEFVAIVHDETFAQIATRIGGWPGAYLSPEHFEE